VLLLYVKGLIGWFIFHLDVLSLGDYMPCNANMAERLEYLLIYNNHGICYVQFLSAIVVQLSVATMSLLA